MIVGVPYIVQTARKDEEWGLYEGCYISLTGDRYLFNDIYKEAILATIVAKDILNYLSDNSYCSYTIEKYTKTVKSLIGWYVNKWEKIKNIDKKEKKRLFYYMLEELKYKFPISIQDPLFLINPQKLKEEILKEIDDKSKPFVIPFDSNQILFLLNFKDKEIHKKLIEHVRKNKEKYENKYISDVQIASSSCLSLKEIAENFGKDFAFEVYKDRYDIDFLSTKAELAKILLKEKFNITIPNRYGISVVTDKVDEVKYEPHTPVESYPTYKISYNTDGEIVENENGEKVIKNFNYVVKYDNYYGINEDLYRVEIYLKKGLLNKFYKEYFEKLINTNQTKQTKKLKIKK